MIEYNETHLFRDHRWTFVSPAPLTRFTTSSPCPTVARGCHATPPTRSLWPRTPVQGCHTSPFLKKPLPLKDVTRVQAGIFHSFTFPDQLPVARYWLFGENRTWAIGRSSPIWEPRLAYVYKKGNILFIIKKKKFNLAYFNLCKDVFSYVKNLAERHGMLVSLLGDSMLSSVRVSEENL